MTDGHWDSEPCSVCLDPLCDARCESAIPRQLILAGLAGAGILVGAAVLKWLITG